MRLPDCLHALVDLHPAFSLTTRTSSTSSGIAKRSSMSENKLSYRMSSYSFAPIPPSSQIIIGPNLSLVKHAHTITFTCALLNVFLTYFQFSLSPRRMDHPLTSWIDANPDTRFIRPNDAFPLIQNS